MKKIVGLFLGFLVILCTSYTATACSCSGQPSACEALSRADTVFTGTVTKTIGPDSNGWGAYRSYVTVEKVYKGSVPAHVQFPWGTTSCDVGMKAGERWLLYASRLNKAGTLWSISQCNGSRLVEESFGDLKYLDGQYKSKQITRLSGTFTYPSGFPIGNAEVEFEGNGKKYSLKTDDVGFYEIYGLEPGNYKLRPLSSEKWSGFRRSGPHIMRYDFDKKANQLTIGIKPNECVETRFNLETENLINGSVVSEDGKPVTDVCVKAVKAGDSGPDSFEAEDCVNGDGMFLINGLPSGSYTLRVEAQELNRPWAPSRFPAVYFPNTVDHSKSERVLVTDDISPEVRIVVPKTHPLRLIEGKVVFSDGSPVEAEMVRFTFRDGPEKRTITALTDNKGRFRLPLVFGMLGRLTAEGRIWGSETRSCPKLRKYWSNEDFSYFFETSRPISMKITNNRSDLSLMLPYSKCAETE